MKTEEKLNLLDFIIDRMCDLEGISETIRFLLCAGCTTDELIEMGFIKEEVENEENELAKEEEEDEE